MINNNFHECDLSTEFLLLRCNKPFHFCSKDTHKTFLLMNFKNKRHINMNQTLRNKVASVMFGFTYSYGFCSKWLTPVFVDCNRFNKSEINEVHSEWTLKRIQE